MSSKDMLIDVRSTEEYAAGHLNGAVNIDYQLIDQLTTQPGVDTITPVTLYCRSGRRSAIALQTLQSIGFTSARNIGGYEQAEETLRREGDERETPHA